MNDAPIPQMKPAARRRANPGPPGPQAELAACLRPILHAVLAAGVLLAIPGAALAQTSQADSLDFPLNTLGADTGATGTLQADSLDFALDTRAADTWPTGVLLADSADFALDTTGADMESVGVLQADSTDFALDTRGTDTGSAGVLQADSPDFTLDTTEPDMGAAGISLADSSDFIVDTRGPDSGGGGLLADSPDFELDTRDVVGAPEITVEHPEGNDLADGLASIDFGYVLPGSSSGTKTFTITNNGTATLTGLVITTNGAQPGDFVVSPPGATILTPGGSTTFAVTFTPAAPGSRNAALHLASNDNDENPFDIGLTGTGTSQVVLDPGFNPDANGQVLCTVAQPDGKQVIGGYFTTAGGSARNYLARLNVSGTLDTGFNPNPNNAIYSATVQADGKIVIGGWFTSVGGTPRRYIARINPDGTLDLGFNPGANSYVYGTAIQPDGKILVGGYFSSVGGTTHRSIVRLNPDGSVDTGFNPSVVQIVYGVALQPDGKIVIGGYFTSVNGIVRNRIARLNGDGSLDSCFNPNANGDVICVAVQPDGKILIGGLFTTVGDENRNRIARLNPDGTVDPEFNPNSNSWVGSMALQTDGRILVSGHFTAVAGMPHSRTARLNPDGTLDSGYVSGANDIVYSTAVQADGNIVLSGPFTSVDGLPRNSIARLLNNEPATQILTVASASIVEWQRGGTSPEATQVSFDLTINGTIWRALGFGTRVNGGWNLTGLSLPANGTIRARARTIGGFFSGSSGLVEQQLSFSGLAVPEVAVEQPAGTDLSDGAASLDFGRLLAGSGSPAKTFTIINRGAADLAGIVIAINGSHPGDFTVGAPGATHLAPGASTTFTVTFTPAVAGSRSAALHLGSNDFDENPFDIELSGTGLTSLECWRLANFGITENAGAAANSADGEHDGVPNLLEFAFGLDPFLNSAHLVPRWQLIDTNLTCIFMQPPGVEGITYGAERSSSMAPGTWIPLVNTGVEPEFIYSMPIESGGKFARLKVTDP